MLKNAQPKHINSKAHNTACQQAKQASTNSNTVTQLQKLKNKTETKMCKLFDSAYTEQPFSLYNTLVSVERKHGVELGVTYHNSKACHIFIENVAGNIRHQLQALKKCEPFYCSSLFNGVTEKQH